MKRARFYSAIPGFWLALELVGRSLGTLVRPFPFRALAPGAGWGWNGRGGVRLRPGQPRAREGGDASASGALEIRELDQVPIPTFQARRAFPASHAKKGLVVSALVDFIVDANGDVVRARAARATHPEFGEAAVAAVQRWKFKPGRKNGRAVATHMQVPINFEWIAPRPRQRSRLPALRRLRWLLWRRQTLAGAIGQGRLLGFGISLSFRASAGSG